MTQHGIELDGILALQSSPALITLLKYQTERAQDYYQQAYDLLPDTDRYSQRTGLIMANIYQTILQEIAEDGYQVMQHRVSLTPLRKLWIAWRTMRSQKRWQAKAA